MTRWYTRVGPLMIATGIVHTIFGVAVGWAALADIWRDGVFNAVEPHRDRESWFWFLMTGWSWMIAGALAKGLERREEGLPPWFAGNLLALGIVGVILVPVSGLWLFFPFAWLAYREAPAAPGDPVRRAALVSSSQSIR